MGKKIDAEELYHRMYKEAFEKDSDLQKWDSGCWIRFKLFENVLKDMPEVEEKTGHWINRHNIYANKTFDTKVCSECQYEYSYDAETGISNANFSPNCGAKMEGETE